MNASSPDRPLAAWMRERRAARRESQAALALIMGKSRSWVASIERGEFRPRAEDAARMAGHFGVATATILRLAGYTREEIRNLGPAAPILGTGAQLVAQEDGDDLIIIPRADLDRLIRQASEQAAQAVLQALTAGRAEPARHASPQPQPPAGRSLGEPVPQGTTQRRRRRTGG